MIAPTTTPMMIFNCDGPRGFSSGGGASWQSGGQLHAAGGCNERRGVEAWLAAAQRGVAVVTRATDPRYLAEDVDIFGWNLTAADLAALDAATEPAAKACLFCSK